MIPELGIERDSAPEGGREARPTEGRLPESLSLGHVRLQIGDLARSLEYYTRVLGLQVRSSDSGSAVLTASDGSLPLVELVERPGTAAIQPHSRLGLYHFALLVPDRIALGRFLEHLAHTGTRMGASDHLVSEAIYLRDPDGLGIEVYADRPRADWRHVNGQIEMATAPLDTESLLALAKGDSWTGMAEGTVMGHVHLHVADLDIASRFYHGALGFDRTVWSYPGALFLSAGGYHHHLGLNTWAGRDAVLPSEREARLLEWRLRFPSSSAAGAAARRLREAGHEVSEADGDWIVDDPWGTRMRLTAS
jgi:catechol 2,3-dioxygenase